MDCKKALTETDGDVEKASDWLREKGIASAAKKAGRAATEGVVHSYIHAGGKIGVLVEINCETDFAAKNEQFQALVKDVAMHIAASAPLAVRREEIPADIVAKEREIYKAQARESGKPENILDKIVEGKVDKFFKDSLPPRAALRQGHRQERGAGGQGGDRRHRREHLRAPLHPLRPRRGPREEGRGLRRRGRQGRRRRLIRGRAA